MIVLIHCITRSVSEVCFVLSQLQHEPEQRLNAGFSLRNNGTASQQRVVGSALSAQPQEPHSELWAAFVTKEGWLLGYTDTKREESPVWGRAEFVRGELRNLQRSCSYSLWALEAIFWQPTNPVQQQSVKTKQWFSAKGWTAWISILHS